MNAIKIRDDIYWVGAIDWSMRSFHGYDTQRGSTYNAYLILDEKITLIDTVKRGFDDELLARISTVMDTDMDSIVRVPQERNSKPCGILTTKRSVNLSPCEKSRWQHSWLKGLSTRRWQNASTLA